MAEINVRRGPAWPRSAVKRLFDENYIVAEFFVLNCLD